jgi:alginate O-acetyltransferase complex protein AlgI
MIVHEFLKREIYGPVVRITGPATATLFAFLFSGILHEVIISIPVRNLYGLPTLYFVIQGVGVLVERMWLRIKTANAFVGWVWTAVVILLPLPLLFNPAYIEPVLFPLYRMLGGRI